MRCHCCRTHVTPVRPKAMWKVLALSLWISSLVVAMLLCVVTGLNIVLAPVALFIGMAVGTSARRLVSWTCPHCASELIEPEPIHSGAPSTPARPLAQPT